LDVGPAQRNNGGEKEGWQSRGLGGEKMLEEQQI